MCPEGHPGRGQGLAHGLGDARQLPHLLFLRTPLGSASGTLPDPERRVAGGEAGTAPPTSVRVPPATSLREGAYLSSSQRLPPSLAWRDLSPRPDRRLSHSPGPRVHVPMTTLHT